MHAGSQLPVADSKLQEVLTGNAYSPVGGRLRLRKVGLAVDGGAEAVALPVSKQLQLWLRINSRSMAHTDLVTLLFQYRG